jgi:hypothetical protein
MGKAFALALMVLSLWVGVSLYTEGWDHAFGGALAKLGFVETRSDPGAAEGKAITNRVRERVGTLYREHEERTRRSIDRD